MDEDIKKVDVVWQRSKGKYQVRILKMEGKDRYWVQGYEQNPDKNNDYIPLDGLLTKWRGPDDDHDELQKPFEMDDFNVAQEAAHKRLVELAAKESRSYFLLIIGIVVVVMYVVNLWEII